MKKTLILTGALLIGILLTFSGCNAASASGLSDSSTVSISSVEDSALDTSELFTDRDMGQSADLTDAVYIELASGEDAAITEEGVYVLSGSAQNATVIVDAGDEEKLQIVLDGVTVENEDSPVIYIKSADKVFVTTSGSNNSMKVTGYYTSDGDINLDVY